MNSARLAVAIVAANLCTAAILYVGYYWHQSATTDATIWEENMARVTQQRALVDFSVGYPEARNAAKIKADQQVLMIAKERPSWAPQKAFEPEIISAQNEIALAK